MKITEEALKEAAQAVDRAMLEGLPPPEAPSPQLLERLGGLSRQQRRKPRWKRIAAQTAACLLALLAAAGIWLAVDMEARAAVLCWFRDITEESYIYQFIDTGQQALLPEYGFQWLPQGYARYKREGNGSYRLQRYRKGQGVGSAYVRLIYFYPKSGTSYVLRGYQGASITHREAAVSGAEADFYLFSGRSDSHDLIWIDPDSGILFHLCSDLPEETMLRMAESLCPRE